jgi:protoheme IX farnesyltransferase
MAAQPAAAAYPVAAATALDYIALLKPRVVSLVAFTGLAGLAAAPDAMPLVTAAAALLALAVGAGAAGALNMWYDADIDARMARTALRPVPAGRIPADEALTFGLVLAALAVTLMALAGGPLAAALLGVSIVFYAVVYTAWLKRRTDQNIVIGGAAGAFPPVIGWAAATGEAPVEAWLLFAVIFVWTPPHFWALSLWTARDYARVGVPMLPVTRGAAETRRQILVYALILAAVGLAPAAFGLGGAPYLATALAGGAAFVALAARLFASRAGEDDGAGDLIHARRLFAFSILHLFALFAALIAGAALT